MASKKGVGSTKNGRDSASKRLGVKRYAGQTVIPGNIIIKQRGTKFHVGNRNVRRGGDDCIYAVNQGVVKFVTKKGKKYVMVLTEADIEREARLAKKAA